MRKSSSRVRLHLLASTTIGIIGIINAIAVLVAYRTITPASKRTENTTLIATGDERIEPNLTPVGTPGVTVAANTNNAPASSTPSVSKSGNTPLVIGQKPQPAKIITNANGTISYQWCSGSNPSLEDGVCKAIISIAADPSESNPYLSAQAKKSLSLLPRDSTLTMHESSWKPTGTTQGTMEVTLHAKTYGDVQLLIILEKKQDTWMVNDGQIL